MPLLQTGLRNIPGCSSWPFQHFTLEWKVWDHQKNSFLILSRVSLKVWSIFCSECALRNLVTKWSSGSPWMSRRRRAFRATGSEQWPLVWRGQAHLSMRQPTTRSGERMPGKLVRQPHWEGQMLIKLIWQNHSKWLYFTLKNIAFHCNVSTVYMHKSGSLYF